MPVFGDGPDDEEQGDFAQAANPQQQAQQQLANVPNFEKPAVAGTAVKIQPADPNYAAEVSPFHPRTIQYFGPDQVTQPTTTHEATHIYQDSRNPGVLGQVLMSRLTGRTGQGYDYGGEDGLTQMQMQHKTIANLGPEQQADLVSNYQQELREAVRTGDAARFDRAKAAYEPLIRQMARLPGRGQSMTTMTQEDLTPAAPGLPPAEESGFLVPSNLMGGPARVLRNPPR